MKNTRFFSSALLLWDDKVNTRQMPWKGEKNPYKIWISEIILQQTRVQQGLSYYNRFIEAFPDVKKLAKAPEKKVYKLWEGLGYYTRCKNLIATAKFIYNDLEGKFPDRYDDILNLKGVGTYTASAIASFAFNLPYAVLDGNVFRVLSRFFGEEIPVNTTPGKKFYAELAFKLLNKDKPAQYNQAIMDFGAVICKPQQPQCFKCPLGERCIAFQKNQVSDLPVNKKVIHQRKRFFNYLIIKDSNKFYVQKRTEKDIWQNLYEFILIETNSLLDERSLLHEKQFLSITGGHDFKIKKMSDKISQRLTHQLITGRFFHIEVKKAVEIKRSYYPVTKQQLSSLPFPKFIASYLADKNVSLNLI
ncbi:MAG: A/G-specific adenine glycosylase [Ginsengibacter sp.]